MALGHGSEIVTNNLLLSLDFANSKNYDSRENLCIYSQLDSGNAAWGQNTPGSGYAAIYTANTTDTLSPDGTYTAAKVAESGTGYQRIVNSCNTPNGVSNVHTWSVYIKRGNSDIAGIEMSGNWTGGGHAFFNFSTLTFTGIDGAMNNNLKYQSVGNGWYRISGNFTPGTTSGAIWLWPGNSTIGASTGAYTYFWGFQVEQGSYLNPYVRTIATGYTRATTSTSTAASLTHTLYNTANGYVSYGNSAVTFTRASLPTKHGGAIIGTGTGNLTLQNFIYNDHTWEVWFRIDDINPLGHSDGTEWWSTLALYQGWHQGFIYTASAMWYLVYHAPTPTDYKCTWTVGASGAQINQGSWYQIAVVRSGNTFTPYLNGAQVGTGFTQATSYWSGTSNNLCLGAAQGTTANTGSYVYYGKNTVSNMKMYNRALSATEIKQNFNALRGRFGI